MTIFLKKINHSTLLIVKNIGLHSSKLVLILKNLIQPLEKNVSYKLIDKFASSNIEKINEGKRNLILGVFFFLNYCYSYFFLIKIILVR